MTKQGRLTESEKDWALEYSIQKDTGDEVIDSGSIYEHFKSKEEALVFAEKNGIEIESIKINHTSSFPCPKCEQTGKRKWTKKLSSGGFICPSCDSTYKSYEGVKDLF